MRYELELQILGKSRIADVLLNQVCISGFGDGKQGKNSS